MRPVATPRPTVAVDLTSRSGVESYVACRESGSAGQPHVHHSADGEVAIMGAPRRMQTAGVRTPRRPSAPLRDPPWR